ncbi:SDR family oxidoreductase [Mycobacterium sp. CVI_P3]|uniref:SDR family oxidoreductase n=1 Tax=Mycobacterium pinniadriaticum TaxID=2994102 RepID=A0ABT3SGT0_9MYCO|nr:SDR family oxidoreductase [Mycobacterium pinniadriaticum]MCX2931815.1 SDR family oxidoreductase [Mycobacterium pinniadriaticum]MCX2938110.1 SDR family oxidoreductase [Mycobacterium pinniadriaticum]
MKNFNGKVAVITGAGSGMGQQIAIQLAEKGAAVAVLDINGASAQETAAHINQNGGRAISYVADVADREAVSLLAARIADELGPADILVNNAGILMKSERFDRMPEEMIERLIDINLRGVLHCTRVFLPQLLSRPEASLVNISSLGGLVGLMYQVPYAAAKFAVRGFSEALRMDMIETNLTVTTVYPGPVATNIFINSPAMSREEGLAGQESMMTVKPVPAEKAGHLIIDGIRKRRPKVVIGGQAKAMDILARIAPNTYTKILYKPVKKMMDATDTGAAAR